MKPRPLLTLVGLAILGGVIALGGGFLLGKYADTHPKGGATATSLRDFEFAVLGGGIGLFCCGVAGAMLVHWRSPRQAGVLTGLLAYFVVIVPLFLATRPRGVDLLSAFGATLVVAIPILICVTLGAAAGAGVQDWRNRRRG